MFRKILQLHHRSKRNFYNEIKFLDYVKTNSKIFNKKYYISPEVKVYRDLKYYLFSPHPNNILQRYYRELTENGARILTDFDKETNNRFIVDNRKLSYVTENYIEIWYGANVLYILYPATRYERTTLDKIIRAYINIFSVLILSFLTFIFIMLTVIIPIFLLVKMLYESPILILFVIAGVTTLIFLHL